MLLALMTGLTLLTGASGLLARQLMARKLGAAESYQQMAEAAAINGFNRILGELNQNDPNNYRGFLFTLNNQENSNSANNGFAWELINTKNAPPLEELCTDTSMGLPIHTSNKEAAWPTGHVGGGIQKKLYQCLLLKINQKHSERMASKASKPFTAYVTT